MIFTSKKNIIARVIDRRELLQLIYKAFCKKGFDYNKMNKKKYKFCKIHSQKGYKALAKRKYQIHKKSRQTFVVTQDIEKQSINYNQILLANKDTEFRYQKVIIISTNKKYNNNKQSKIKKKKQNNLLNNAYLLQFTNKQIHKFIFII
ncbi:hypothetical protein ABPG74_002850 [Tetrahymena malaccensis]